jgi:histone acetyltransferase 1
LGIGAHLLQTIYREYIARKDVTDITGNKNTIDGRILRVFYAFETICRNKIVFSVESPSLTFQKLRNYVDAVNCSKLPTFKVECLKQGFSNDMVTEAKNKLKINKVFII